MLSLEHNFISTANMQRMFVAAIFSLAFLATACTASESPETAVGASAANQMETTLQMVIKVINQLVDEVLIYRKVRSQTNETQHRLREIEDFIDKRVRLFIPLPSSLEQVRVIARSIYKSYVFYRPEINLVQCMHRFARTEFPEIVDLLRMDEFGRSGHTAYRTFVLITDNLLKFSAMGLQSRQGKRDTSKISPDATNDRLRKRSTGPLSLGPSTAQQLFRLRIKTEPKEPLAVAATRNDPVSMGNPSAGSLNTAALLDNSVIAPATNTSTEKQSPDPFESFNMEHFVLRSLGLDPESIKEWTPMYCGKEYVKDFLRRFTHTVILA